VPATTTPVRPAPEVIRFKRLRMVWCAIRGGHILKMKRYRGVSDDLMLDCTRCPWSALIVLRPHEPKDVRIRRLVGRRYEGFYLDEIEKCPDCGASPDTHLLYRNGQCPVVRVALHGEPLFPTDDIPKGDQ